MKKIPFIVVFKQMQNWILKMKVNMMEVNDERGLFIAWLNEFSMSMLNGQIHKQKL